MKKTITILSITFSLLLILSLGLYMHSRMDIFETLSITFGVTAYHFIMRLGVGLVLDALLKNNVDGSAEWFREKPFEDKLYRLLKVKGWKKHMPTYRKEYFDIKQRTVKELIGASCQAELVHETIVILSFLPVILCIWFDPDAVFIVTSALAALFDSVFVVMQRYNRPRLKRLLDRRGR